jgi:ABC-type amino acid transport substrate-binding protein
LLGFFDDRPTLAYRIQSEGYSDRIAIHPSFVLSSNDVYFGVSNTISAETLKKLQEANERLLAAGKYQEINLKWEKFFEQPLVTDTVPK